MRSFINKLITKGCTLECREESAHAWKECQCKFQRSFECKSISVKIRISHGNQIFRNFYTNDNLVGKSLKTSVEVKLCKDTIAVGG